MFQRLGTRFLAMFMALAFLTGAMACTGPQKRGGEKQEEKGKKGGDKEEEDKGKDDKEDKDKGDKDKEKGDKEKEKEEK